MSFDRLPRFHEPARLAVLLSGSGRTLENLLAHIDSGDLPAAIPLVIASRECPGAEKARAAGIKTHVHAGPLDREWLDGLCREHEIDLIVLAGYLKLVPITDYTRDRIVNIHPALLPSFGGKGMHGAAVHRAVIEAAGRGEVAESGCTVHFADEQYDTGSTIVQLRCPLDPNDTPEQLAKRVFALECEAFPRAIRMLIERNAAASRTKSNA